MLMSKDAKIFNDQGFVFISIPKTATNSIWNTVLSDPSYKPFQHAYAKKIKPIIENYYPSRWESLYKFACVRHPYSMLVSWYKYHKYHDDISQNVKNFYNCTFDEWANDRNFVTHWEWDIHRNWNPLWTGENPLHQWKWIYENDNCIVDKIIRYENLEKDLADVGKKISLIRSLKKLNYSNDKKILLSKQTKQKINDTFNKDFVIFDFKMEE